MKLHNNIYFNWRQMRSIIGGGLLILFITTYLVCCKDNSGLSPSEKDKNERIEIADKIQPQIVFAKTSHSFGKINKMGPDAVMIDFSFTNHGERPLIIKKVDVSCGCLSANFSRFPIKKDSIGFIRVIVNPQLLNGYFNKSVFVTSNSTDEVNLLKVQGTVN